MPLGSLYADGHVRVSHGQGDIFEGARGPYAPVAAGDHRHGTNGACSEPLFVVTAEANASLVAMLSKLLAEVCSLAGACRLITAFDRGGRSPRALRHHHGRLSGRERPRSRRRAPTIRRAHDEGQTLVQAILTSTTDKCELSLAPMSSPHRTRPMAAQCHWRLAVGAAFSGTLLRLVSVIVDRSRR